MNDLGCCYCFNDLPFPKMENGEEVTCPCGGVNRLVLDPEGVRHFVEEVRCPHGVETPPGATENPELDDVDYCEACEGDDDPSRKDLFN